MLELSTLELAGPILALVTFLTIWGGHVMVRIVHYYTGTKLAPVVFGAGMLLLLASTQTAFDTLGAGMGIIGLTMLWDAFEIHRQEGRVRLGHAPLNPRVHKVAAGLAAAQFAEQQGTVTDEGGLCLSCGSNPNSRFLCRKGPYCQVRQWERYSVPEAAQSIER